MNSHKISSTSWDVTVQPNYHFPGNQPQSHGIPGDYMSTKISWNTRSPTLISNMKGKSFPCWKAEIIDVRPGNVPQQVEELTHIMRTLYSTWREILVPWHCYLRWYMRSTLILKAIWNTKSCTQAGLSITSYGYP